MKRVRLGCLGLGSLGLLAACAILYAGLQSINGEPPAQPRPQQFDLGPFTVMSGLTYFDDCASFELPVDKWRCTNTFFSRQPDQLTAYRLWLFAPWGNALRPFKLIDLPIVLRQ